MAVGSRAITRGGGGWSTWRDVAVMWGVEKGGDVAVVVFERGRQWGRVVCGDVAVAGRVMSMSWPLGWPKRRH